MSWWDTLMASGYAEAIFIVLGSFIVATLLDFILIQFGKKWAKKKELVLVQNIIEKSHKPVYFLLLVSGIYFGMQALSLSEFVSKWDGRIYFVLAALLTASLINRVSSVLVVGWLKVSRRYEKTPELINKIITVVIYIVGFLVILDYFKIQISPIIATLGLGGLAIGLALQDTLKDFFAGLHIISDQPIKVGNFIELEGSELKGYVEDIGWRSTRIRTLPNNYVIIPNSKLAASTIHNTSMPQKEMACLVEVGVDYTSDLEKVQEVTVEVAREIQKTVEGAVEDFEPFIRLHTFGDNNINFTVILRVKQYVDKFLVRNEFMKALHKRYKKEGIEISWPIRKVYDMHKGK